MATDKHYNEPGAVPEALEDHKGTDKQATRGIFVAILIVAVIALIGGLIIYFS